MIFFSAVRWDPDHLLRLFAGRNGLNGCSGRLAGRSLYTGGRCRRAQQTEAQYQNGRKDSEMFFPLFYPPLDNQKILLIKEYSLFLRGCNSQNAPFFSARVTLFCIARLFSAKSGAAVLLRNQRFTRLSSPLPDSTQSWSGRCAFRSHTSHPPKGHKTPLPFLPSGSRGGS